MKFKSLALVLVFAASLVAVLGLFGCEESSESVPFADGDDTTDGDIAIQPGHEGGPCYQDNTCEPGLECRYGICREIPLGDGDEEIEPEAEAESLPEEEVEAEPETELEPEAEQEAEPEIEQGEAELPPGPVLALYPDRINFGSVPVGQTVTRPIRLTNIGDSLLSVQNVQFIQTTPNSPGSFSFAVEIEHNFTLAPTETVTIDINFTRNAVGLAESKLSVISNDVILTERRVRLYSDFTGNVSLGFTPTLVEFGMVPIKEFASKSLTVQNLAAVEDGGTLVIEHVAIKSPEGIFHAGEAMPAVPISVAPQQSTLLPFIAYTDLPQSYDGSLLLYHNDAAQPYPLEIPLHIFGVVPKLEISPSPVEFSPLMVGDTSMVLVSLRNMGGDDLNIQSAELTAISSVYFSVDLDPDEDGTPNLPALVPSAETVTVGIRFTPAQVGNFGGELHVFSDSYESPDRTVLVSGSGVPPALSITPGALDFPCVQVNHSQDLSVHVEYGGAAELSIGGIFINNSNSFKVTGAPTTPLPLTQGTTFDIFVRYEPLAATDEETATLVMTVGTTDPIRYELPLKGCAVASKIGIEFDDVNSFQEVQILPKPMAEMTDEEKLRWVAHAQALVRSKGTAPLHVSSIQVKPANSTIWAVEAELPAVIQPGESMSFDIAWGPTQITNYFADIVVCSDAVDASGEEDECDEEGHRSTHLQFYRTPEELKLMVDPSSIDFGHLGPGEEDARLVYIENTRAGKLRIESITINGGSDYTITAFDPPPAEDGWVLTGRPGEQITVQVRFAPQSGDNQNAALVIRHNDKDATRSGGTPGQDYPEFNVWLMGNGGVNNPPVAIAKSPQGVPEGQQGTLSRVVALGTDVVVAGDESYDPDSANGDMVASYAWTVDQTSGYLWFGSPSSAVSTLRFITPGRYVVRLDVRDTFGAHSFPTPDSKLELAVQGDPTAVAVIRGTQETSVEARVNIPVPLDGSQSTDPDGQVVNWRWYLKEKNALAYPDDPFSTDPQPNLTFTSGGWYTIGLDVVDNDGRVSKTKSEIQAHVLANDTIKLEVAWSGGGDVDMHYVRPGSSFGSPGDCNPSNLTPDWSTQGHGHPKMTQTSADGILAEIISHDDPGDGVYKLSLQFVSSLQNCEVVQDCVWLEENCNECGCSCPPFCFIQGICCNSCNFCEDVTVCHEIPANPIFRIYLNGASTPTKILSGDKYMLNNAGAKVEIQLPRVEGSFVLPD